jgi:thioredoxin-related protein
MITKFSTIASIIVLSITANCQYANAQESNALYDPELDGVQQVHDAEATAAAEGKYVLVQVGGNWCSWCHKLHKLFTSNDKIRTELKKNFVMVHLNYSKENRNENALRLLDNPERFGFPVLVILDGKGQRLHTQDTALLESEGSHDPQKVLRVLTLWSPQAVLQKRDE